MVADPYSPTTKYKAKYSTRLQTQFVPCEKRSPCDRCDGHFSYHFPFLLPYFFLLTLFHSIPPFSRLLAASELECTSVEVAYEKKEKKRDLVQNGQCSIYRAPPTPVITAKVVTRSRSFASRAFSPLYTNIYIYILLLVSSTRREKSSINTTRVYTEELLRQFIAATTSIAF